MLVYKVKFYDDDEEYVYAYNKKNTSAGYVDIAKTICFSDCGPRIEELQIWEDNREVEYTGWQPNMIMEFAFVDTGELTYSGRFSNWDH